LVGISRHVDDYLPDALIKPPVNGLGLWVDDKLVDAGEDPC
jgi:hypothetical protein